jgi:hypothetical protein
MIKLFAMQSKKTKWIRSFDMLCTIRPGSIRVENIKVDKVGLFIRSFCAH